MPSKSRKPPCSQSSSVLAKTTDGLQQATLPDWPMLKPLIPRIDLSLVPILDQQILVIHSFFTATLCKTYVRFLASLPLITTPGTPKKGDAARVNDRYEIMDADFAKQLWEGAGLAKVLKDAPQDVVTQTTWGGEPLGLNPRIRIYRYRKGQFFDCHYDESNLVTLPTAPKPTPARTTWTLLLYLTSPTEGCLGGETVFYPDDPPGKNKVAADPIVVGLETGMLLLHKHGSDCMLHEGREVLAGEKWVIRTDLCVKR